MSMRIGIEIQSGELPEDLYDAYDAHHLATIYDALADLARSLGLSALDAFTVAFEDLMEEGLEGVDDEAIEGAFEDLGSVGPWFEPAEAIRSVDGMIAHLEGFQPGDPRGLLETLRGLAMVLEAIRDQGAEFRLVFS